MSSSGQADKLITISSCDTGVITRGHRSLLGILAEVIRWQD